MWIEIFLQLGVGHMAVMGEVVDKIAGIFIDQTEFSKALFGVDDIFSAHVIARLIFSVAGAIVEHQ